MQNSKMKKAFTVSYSLYYDLRKMIIRIRENPSQKSKIMIDSSVMKQLRNIPIGIQSFETMREGSYVYVDKTGYIPSLEKLGCVYFLSRPRRFGKSLFLSTLKAYFEGRRELFKGLKIERIKEENGSEWEEVPVLHLDLSGKTYKEKDELQEVLNANIEKWKKQFDISFPAYSPELAFEYIIRELHHVTQKQVVVLVDEYDAPLLSSLKNDELSEHYRALLKGFYTVLKKSNEHIKLAFLTGVTKFASVTIFSGLNNLYDISLSDEYAELCGITEKEMIDNFSPEIMELASKQNTTFGEMIDLLKKEYDGYHFSKSGRGIYNPFSLCNALATKDISAYWFGTGTPTFLVDLLEKHNFDIPILDDGNIVRRAEELRDYRAIGDDIIPLLFQSGYLTIKGYKPKFNMYTLGFPNNEVRYAFLQELIAKYTKGATARDSTFSLYNFTILMEEGNIEEVLERIKALFASIPYDSFRGDEKIVMREYNVQMIIYLLFRLMGQYLVSAEVHSSRGRSDVEVETDDAIYIFEFKTKATANEALEQIEKQGYHEKHGASGKRIVLIGASIQEDGRNIGEWKIKEA